MIIIWGVEVSFFVIFYSKLKGWNKIVIVFFILKCMYLVVL